MFRTIPLSIIRSFSLYTQQWDMFIQVCWQLASRIRMELVQSWSCSQTVWHIPLLCVQSKTHDDGQRNCPKHVEFYSKNKFEKFRPDPARKLSPKVYDIYHCCVYSEKLLMMGTEELSETYRVYSKNKFEKLVHLVGFIIRIYHDARSAERQISKVSEREELVHLVAFIIRIYHDARSAERQISKVSKRERN